MKPITIERFYDLLERSKTNTVELWNKEDWKWEAFVSICKIGSSFYATYDPHDIMLPISSINLNFLYERRPHSAFDELLDIQTGHNGRGLGGQYLLDAAGYSEWKENYKDLLQSTPGVMDTEEEVE